MDDSGQVARDTYKRAHGVVVSHPLRMRKALGSIPSGSIHKCFTSRKSVACLLPNVNLPVFFFLMQLSYVMQRC